MSTSTDPTAIVSEYARLGSGVVIGPFSEVGASAWIGDGSSIVGAVIEGKVGRDCRIWRQAHVWAGAVIGDRCMLGQGVMVARATVGNNVRIQNGSTIPHGAVIEDDVYIGAGVRLCNSVHPSATREDELVPIILRRGCSIGSNACIVGKVEIGEGAVVGAGAVVTRDVPAGHKALGVPALIFGPEERYSGPTVGMIGSAAEAEELHIEGDPAALKPQGVIVARAAGPVEVLDE